MNIKEYVKFRKGSKYCLLDEKGNSIIKNNNKSLIFTGVLGGVPLGVN